MCHNLCVKVLIEEGQKLKASQKEALDLSLEVQQLQYSNKEKTETLELLQKEQEAASAKVGYNHVPSICSSIEAGAAKIS
jgi:hypothetical protein